MGFEGSMAIPAAEKWEEIQQRVLNGEQVLSPHTVAETNLWLGRIAESGAEKEAAQDLMVEATDEGEM